MSTNQINQNLNHALGMNEVIGYLDIEANSLCLKSRSTQRTLRQGNACWRLLRQYKEGEQACITKNDSNKRLKSNKPYLSIGELL